MKLAHLALAVRDQERSRSFYETYFRFDAGPSNVLDSGVLFLRNEDGFELALAERGDPAPLPPFVHFGFRLDHADDVRVLRHGLATAGFDIFDEEEEADFVSFKCRDPDGYLVQLYWSESP